MPELRVGGCYVRRDGREVGPLVATVQDGSYLARMYPFTDPANDKTYTELGLLFAPGRPSPADLVSYVRMHGQLPDVEPVNTTEVMPWA